MPLQDTLRDRVISLLQVYKAHVDWMDKSLLCEQDRIHVAPPESEIVWSLLQHLGISFPREASQRLQECQILQTAGQCISTDNNQNLHLGYPQSHRGNLCSLGKSPTQQCSARRYPHHCPVPFTLGNSRKGESPGVWSRASGIRRGELSCI